MPDVNGQGSQNPTIEATQKQFSGAIPALDSLLGGDAGQGQDQETQNQEGQTQNQASDQGQQTQEGGEGRKSMIRTLSDNDDEGNAEGEPTGSPEAQNDQEGQSQEGGQQQQASSSDQDDEVDLDELVIEHNGQERTVSEIITTLEAELVEARKAKAALDDIQKDQFLKDFIEHYRNHGNVVDYLQARAVDYDAKSDLEVLRMKFDEDHADFNEKTRDLLWKKELTDKYKVNAELTDEEKQSDEYQISQALLERDAKNARKTFKDRQAKFQIAERPKPAEDASASQPKHNPEEFKKTLLGVKEVQGFMKSKILKLGITDESGKAYGFEPENPDQIIEMMADDRKFWNQFVRDGKPNVEKLMKVYAFAMDPELYDKQLVEFGKDLALEERLKNQSNTDNRLNRQASPAPTEQSESRAMLEAALKAKQAKMSR